jgi:FkbM family methyltransferase
VPGWASFFLIACVLLTNVHCGRRPARPSTTHEREWDIFLAGAAFRFPTTRPELIIRHFFRDQPAGFFVDVGAGHFRQWSTTYFLEVHLAWSGIAIDAQERYAADYAKKRPRTKFFVYIVTDHTAAEEPFYVFKPNLLGSTALKERADKMGKTLPIEEVMVPTITLNDLLAREGVTGIDLLSVDIEGGELLALAGFDIERFAPALVCIEAFRENQAALLEYFENHGYRRIDRYLEYDRANWYFTPQQ